MIVMKKIILFLCMIVLASLNANAQGWVKKIGSKAKETIERKSIEEVEEQTEKTFDKSVDKVEKSVTNENADETEASDDSNETGSKPQNKKAQQSWNKFDFVAGNEIIFDDNLTTEKNGEFPSRWDLKEGGAEITQLDGANAISIIGYTYITPLFKDNSGYLPEDFTVEFDYYTAAEKDGELSVLLYDKESDPNKIFEVRWWSRNANNSFPFNWIATNDVYRSGEDTADNSEGWHRFSLSFNKRALKAYIDDKRIINIPNVGKKPGKLDIWGNGDDAFIKNFRIAKGAVPLYDKFLSDGKIITYGITFDTGKATLKPQSMGTINEIYKIMTDHPELKFSVEGHTDNTGNQASNQTLSESRALAVMDKLSEMGISKSRLATKGHGQNAPVSDNNSDEGRAKNRRVEFVKF